MVFKNFKGRFKNSSWCFFRCIQRYEFFCSLHMIE